MKTTSFNAEKEIRIGILVAVFALSIFTAVRVKELQLTEATNSNETRSGQIMTNSTNTSSMPLFDARLIDEPVPEVEAMIKNIEYKASEFVKAEMASETEKFMNVNHTATEAEPALEAAPWMTASEYKAADFVNAELAIESEKFLNGNDAANEAEPLIEVAPWMTATEYKAADFANAEMTAESERFLNGNVATAEAEPWMTANLYKATDFVNAELAAETERFLNGTDDEVATAETSEDASILAIE